MNVLIMTMPFIHDVVDKLQDRERTFFIATLKPFIKVRNIRNAQNVEGKGDKPT